MASKRPETEFGYEQSPHIEKRKEFNVLDETKPRTLNAKIGFNITRGVGTMWAAYAFFALTLVSLPSVISKGDPIQIVAWIAQTFLQLVLLPIIIVGQNIQAAAAEKRAILTYEDAAAVLEESIKIQKHLDHQDKALSHLIDRIEDLENKLIKK
ncbi:MAG: DUF1003 domain-containing protein [Micrococcales bacterium]|nr:DUF1003 domain-containing protein [Micrococcales bacterium]NBR61323.1 DUF1003 domain-containing protein [Actinomycetota bacterium]NBR55040.1 DUF1003 domain-containing protein [Micrococcales bacterium]NBT47432.1 DUF1003 domain-containing protein [Actinomycetota bacterium]NBY43368.1 DUF1003 domain-containing protein [Micrococcales bacterium]